MAAMFDANNNVMHKNRAPFTLIGRFLQLQAQNNADESPKKPKGSRKMTGRRKNDRALNKTTGRCALSFRPSENPAQGLGCLMHTIDEIKGSGRIQFLGNLDWSFREHTQKIYKVQSVRSTHTL